MYKLKYATTYEYFDLKNIIQMWPEAGKDDRYIIQFIMSSGNKLSARYSNKDDAFKEMNEINELIKGEKSMLKSIGSDLKEFLAEHKSVIYWIAVALLADHVFFNGAFREKLHGLMNKLLGKVEAQIEGKPGVALVPETKA